MVRLFISINVPIEIKERLASFQRKLVDLVQGSFTPVENMHLTLKFLGDVDEERIEQIKDACSEAINTSCFTAEIKGTGAFPSENYIRVVWVGVGSGADLLANIKTQLDEKLTPLGFKDDFEFRPHVTLARVKKVLYADALKKLIENNRGTDFGKFRVAKVSLMKSEQRKDGSLCRRSKASASTSTTTRQMHTELDSFDLS